jgi:hypothetical protein
VSLDIGPNGVWPHYWVRLKRSTTPPARRTFSAHRAKVAAVIRVVKRRLAQTPGDDVSNEDVFWPVVRQPIQLVQVDPGRLDVVWTFQPRCSEVAIDLNQKVDLTP